MLFETLRTYLGKDEQAWLGSSHATGLQQCVYLTQKPPQDPTLKVLSKFKKFLLLI